MVRICLIPSSHYNNGLSIKSLLAIEGQCFLQSSFSVKVGYFVATHALIQAANKLLRRIIDRQGDPLLERALSALIKSGELQRHLKKSVKIYEQRRNYFCEQLERSLLHQLSFTKPEGGMSLWVTFKDHELLKSLPDQLLKKGYLLETDNIFMEEFNGVRIGFASLDEEKIDGFIAALKTILK